MSATSEARLIANRPQSRPRTAEAKERSRANALKLGLCSSAIVPESLEAIQERTTEWFFALKPQNDFQGWLVDRIAVVSLRIERAERMERRYRDRRSLSAELSWDDDLRLAAERLGGRIGSRPAEIVEELRRTPCGCEWLISRWAMLAHAADTNPDHAWTAEQAQLAVHLLGTPAEFRDGPQAPALLDPHGRVIESTTDRAALARREVDALLARRDEVAAMDEVDRALAESDLFDECHPALKNLRRHEGTLHNRLRWYLKEMRFESPYLRPDRELTDRKIVFRGPPVEPKPAIESAPVSALVSAPPPAPKGKARAKPPGLVPWEITAPHPAIGIEAHEVPADGSNPDPFQILLSRQEKREKKAESRREARRRKAERLRG